LDRPKKVAAVRLQQPHDALTIERQVGDRREIVEIDEPVACHLQRQLRMRQRFVLNHQLLLIHRDLVNQ
jgi:hypothetical protein